jgi:hypothetical protein
MIIHGLAAIDWRMNARIEARSPGLHSGEGVSWVPESACWKHLRARAYERDCRAR